MLTYRSGPQTFDHLPLDNGRFSVLLGGVDAPFTPEVERGARGGDGALSRHHGRGQ